MRRFEPALTHLVTALAVTAAAVLTAFALPLPAHALTITLSGGSGQAVDGSGRTVSVVRKVGPFSVLRVDGPLAVHARPGAAPGVTVHAEDNVEPLIETVVDGDALVVRMRDGTSVRTRHEVVVDVVFTTLTAAQQHGSGDLHIDKVSAPRFESTITGSGDLQIDDARLGSFALSIAGSGDAAISGTADEASFGVIGSGTVKARRFAARRVSVNINGSGDAHVNATQAIDARVAGSGDVTYAGNPHEVSRRVSGSGSIEASH